jgi:hypothetical protein
MVQYPCIIYKKYRDIFLAIMLELCKYESVGFILKGGYYGDIGFY